MKDTPASPPTSPVTSRRRFVKAAAAVSSVLAAPAFVRGQNLNSKLQLAAIGCDGKGWSDTKEMSTHDRIQHVGFCDIDLNRTLNVKKLNPEVPIYQDFREMLGELGDKVDAVTVSTPDHMHAYITLAAMRQGKHVYCQKPLTHNVWENRQVKKMAAKSGVITRLGNQIHSHEFYRTAVQTIQAGKIGKITRVHSWVGATGHGKSGFIDRPKENPPVPDTIAWDNWIGVAPMRPYVDAGLRCYHPWGWRDWQDFGNGALGDFGCHILDPVYTALKIAGPSDDIQCSEHTGMNDEVWAAQNMVHFTVPGTEHTVGDRLRITWYDGGLIPGTKGSHVPGTRALPRSGSLLIGETGTMVLPHVGAPSIFVDGRDAPEDSLLVKADNRNHYHGWVDGCLSGEQPSDGFDYGSMLTEAVLLGNIAVRFKQETLKWDSANLKFTNHEEANRWVTRDYREGWEIKPVA
ncbi:MAG: Gfo/Idh/MocA family oxidoreductase [Verrucomicrobiae bacterium]|nr:Gfo/Idh/MocA family oxidoreductase [Verrucomicrobiae bacterium]